MIEERISTLAALVELPLDMCLNFGLGQPQLELGVLALIDRQFFLLFLGTALVAITIALPRILIV